MVGGLGSPSGKQGHMVRGLNYFDGGFHYLDDVWELDLEKNAWRCLLSLGHLEPDRLRAAAFFPRLRGLVIFEGMKVGDNQPNHISLARGCSGPIVIGCRCGSHQKESHPG